MTEFIYNQNRQLRGLVKNYPFLFTNRTPVASSNAEYLAKCGYPALNKLASCALGQYHLDILKKYEQEFLFGRVGSNLQTPYEFTFYLGNHFHLFVQINDLPTDMGEAAAPKESRFTANLAACSFNGALVKAFATENKEFEVSFQRKQTQMGFAHPLR